MNFSLITGIPIWFILLCFLAAGSYTGILYFRNRRDEYPIWLTRLLAVFRFVSILVITFLLLSPLVKISKQNTEKPIVIIAADNSGSMTYIGAGEWMNGELNDFLSGLPDYELYLYSFGDEPRIVESNQFDSINLDLSEKYTNITSVLESINDNFYNRNVGAVILISDGITNSGVNPLYMQDEFAFPLYTVALGDTNVKKDISIRTLNYNAIAYKGNDFPVEVIVQADNCSGQEFSLSVFHEGKVMDSRKVNVNSNRQSTELRFNLSADKAGIARYTFILGELDGEENILNNRKRIYIDILDEKMNIAIVANSPHPDISAIKDAISKNFSYSVEDYLVEDFNHPLEKFNLLILHQVPSYNSASVQLANRVKNSDVPFLIIIGEQTNLDIFNSLDLGMSIIPAQTRATNEAQAVFNEFFSYFTLDQDSRELLKSMPPLFVPFGDYQLSSEGEVLFFQEIVGVETSNPLIYCLNEDDRRHAFISGDGIWRWKLTDYALNQNHESFTEIINKLIKYLALQVDKRQFKLVYDHQTFENQKVTFRAELYNDIYEFVSGNEIDFLVTNEEGQEFNFQFSALEGEYLLELGILPPGRYEFVSRTSLGDKIFSDKGEFSILPVNIESVNTIADHRLLYNLAAKNQGKMYYPAQLGELQNDISDNENIKAVIYSQKSYTDLIDIPWVLAFILLLLAAEWLLRKWGGSY